MSPDQDERWIYHRNQPAPIRAEILKRIWNGSANNFGPFTHLRGCMGEDAFAHLFRLPYPTVVEPKRPEDCWGDSGIDFRLRNRSTVDVKVTRDKYDLKVRCNRGLLAERYVFSLWDTDWPRGEDAQLLGWLPAEAVKKFPIEDGYNSSKYHRICYDEIRPISLLYNLERATYLTLKSLKGEIVE